MMIMVDGNQVGLQRTVKKTKFLFPITPMPKDSKILYAM